MQPVTVETLFRTFGRRWAHRWEKTNADPKARALWLHDLRVLGVTEASIRVGLTRSAGLEWPPSPAEFAVLCKPRPEDLGIPGLEAAWREALDLACGRKRREECSNPVVWHAYYEAGPIGMMPEEKGRKVFEYYYGKAVELALAGEPLREIPKPLPAPGEQTRKATQAEREAAMNDAMAKINKMLGRNA